MNFDAAEPAAGTFDRPNLRLLRGGMPDPQPAAALSVVAHAKPSEVQLAEVDKAKAADQLAHEIMKDKLEAAENQRKRAYDAAEAKRQRDHELLLDKNRRDHAGRMLAGICIAVGVFGLAGYLVYKDMTQWAIGVIVLAVSNTVSFVFGRRIEVGDLRQVFGGLPIPGQLPTKAGDDQGPAPSG